MTEAGPEAFHSRICETLPYRVRCPHFSSEADSTLRRLLTQRAPSWSLIFAAATGIETPEKASMWGNKTVSYTPQERLLIV